MEELRQILAEKHRIAKEREAAIEKAAKKQKLEKCKEEFLISLVFKIMRRTLIAWKRATQFPWYSEGMIILNFFRSIPRSGIPQSFPNFLETDTDIRLNSDREYALSLENDKSRETVKLTYWINKLGFFLEDHFYLNDYVDRMVTLYDFREEMSLWPNLKMFLFWIKVSECNKIFKKLPRWLNHTNESLATICQDNLSFLQGEISFYQKYQCPECDGLFRISEMQSNGDYEVCIFCSMRNKDYCLICNSMESLKKYEAGFICDNCAQVEGIYVEEEKSICIKCGLENTVNNLKRHPVIEDIYFCNGCFPARLMAESEESSE